MAKRSRKKGLVPKRYHKEKEKQKEINKSTKRPKKNADVRNAPLRSKEDRRRVERTQR